MSNRYAVVFSKSRNRLGGLADVDTTSAQEDRAVRLSDHRSGSLKARTVWSTAQRRRRFMSWINVELTFFKAPKPMGDILWHIDNNWARTAGSSNGESPTHNFWDTLDTFYPQ
jgi:hypothetical protein